MRIWIFFTLNTPLYDYWEHIVMYLEKGLRRKWRWCKCVYWKIWLLTTSLCVDQNNNNRLYLFLVYRSLCIGCFSSKKKIRKRKIIVMISWKFIMKDNNEISIRSDTYKKHVNYNGNDTEQLWLLIGINVPFSLFLDCCYFVLKMCMNIKHHNRNNWMAMATELFMENGQHSCTQLSSYV